MATMSYSLSINLYRKSVPIAYRCSLAGASTPLKKSLVIPETPESRLHSQAYRSSLMGPRSCRLACRASDLKQDHEPLKDIRWSSTLATLAALGAFFGPPMDGFHTNVNLLEYDRLAMTLGSWKTSLADVPLLALYYSVAGSLLLLLDRLWPSKSPPPQSSIASVALQFGLLATFLQLSSVMYNNGTGYDQIWAVLGVTAVMGWLLTDGTKQAAVLGLLSFAICPVAEALLMRFGGVWHYPRADLIIGGEGVTSWVACCYAFYTVSLAPVARLVAGHFSVLPQSSEE